MDRSMGWSEELSVGIEEIDSQHMLLVELLKEMHDAIEDHRDLIRHIGDLKQALASGKTAAGVAATDFLKTWLSTHIVAQDMQYSSFFLTPGSEPKPEKKGWVSRSWNSLHH